MKRWVSSLALGVSLSLSSIASVYAQACDPKDFMLRDTEKVTWSEDIQSLFVLNSSKEEFEKAQKAGNLTSSYGVLDWKDAREMARRETLSVRSTFKSNRAYSYLSQRLSPLAAQMYADCLRNNTSTIGLRIWLREQEGSYYNLEAMWVGKNEKDVGAYDEPPIARGLEIIQKPKMFSRATVHRFTVFKEPCSEGYLGLEVGGQQRSIVLLPDGQLFGTVEETVSSPKPLIVTTNAGVGTSGSICLSASKGGYLVPGSGDVDHWFSSEPGQFGKKFTGDLNKICLIMSQSTSAKERQQHTTGILTATLRYTVPIGGCAPKAQP